MAPCSTHTTVSFMAVMTAIVCVWSQAAIASSVVEHERVGLELTTTSSSSTTFKAAVLEHKAFLRDNPTQVLSRKDALGFMKKNLDVYKAEATKAKDQGAQIIVFPENGIYGYDFSRESLAPFLEQIPDPENTTWVPCSDSKSTPQQTDVQRELSCIAKTNKMYVVANMADKVPCQAESDPDCPKIGHYQYNTNVAFSSDGKLVAKYHKVHLWFEDYFDAATPKAAYFNTPFAGRIGLVICYDLFFSDPLMALVTEHNATTIAYPTDWADFPPLVTAIGFHSGVARGLGINILAANFHNVPDRAYGSGIYTQNGASTFYYNNRNSSPGKLMVSSINAPPKQRTTIGEQTKKIDIAMKDESKNDTFDVKIFSNIFKFKLLDGSSGNVNVCNKNACCSLNYSRSSDHHANQNELFALGVCDGLNTQYGRFYWQVCTLVKCANDEKTKCGWPANFSSTTFESLSMKGYSQAKHLYPQVILSSGDQDGQMLLADEDTWSFNDNTIAWEGGVVDKPVLAVTTIGRLFDRDNGDDGPSGKRKDAVDQKSTDNDNDHDSGPKSTESQAVLVTVLLIAHYVLVAAFILI